MLADEEKQALERLIKENPDRKGLQQQLQRYLNSILDRIITTEDASESTT